MLATPYNYDYIAEARRLIQLLEESGRFQEHREKILSAIESASTGNELIFALRFICARMVMLEQNIPEEILLVARKLFKELDLIIESA